MLTLVAVIHVLIALGLVLFVLLQDPKGGAAGVFGGGGGGSNSLFGATGAGNFLTSTTKWLAIFFAVTCVGLTYLTSHNTDSVMDDYVPAGGGAMAPATDAAPAAAAPVETDPAESETMATPNPPADAPAQPPAEATEQKPAE